MKGELGCIVLAAGLSRRAGPINKLLFPIEGEPVVRRTVSAILDSKVSESVVVVVGYQANAVREALQGLPVRFVHNEAFEKGMGRSLAIGAQAMKSESLAGILVCMGDLPWLDPEAVKRVASAFRDEAGARVVIPRCGGVVGHPVAFPFRLVDSLATLDGDRGAKEVIAAASTVPRFIHVGVGCIRDIDIPLS